MQGHDTDRVKIDDWTWSITCLQCGTVFESKRSDATFCHVNCRQRFSKEPQKLLNTIQALKDDGYKLVNIAEKYKHNTHVFEEMKALRDRLNYALSIFEG